MKEIRGLESRESRRFKSNALNHKLLNWPRFMCTVRECVDSRESIEEGPTQECVSLDVHVFHNLRLVPIHIVFQYLNRKEMTDSNRQKTGIRLEINVSCWQIMLDLAWLLTLLSSVRAFITSLQLFMCPSPLFLGTTLLGSNFI